MRVYRWFAATLIAAGQLSPAVVDAKPAAEAQIRNARRQYDSALARRDLAALSKLTTAEVQRRHLL